MDFDSCSMFEQNNGIWWVVASVYDILSINRKDSGNRQAIIKWVKYKLLDPKIKGENDTMLIFVSQKIKFNEFDQIKFIARSQRISWLLSLRLEKRNKKEEINRIFIEEKNVCV